jgi:hypothetical protein
LGLAFLPTLSLLFTGWIGEFSLAGFPVTAEKAAPAWIACALLCSIWVQLQVRAFANNIADTQIDKWGFAALLVAAARSYPKLFRWIVPALPLATLSVALGDVVGVPLQAFVWCLILVVPLLASGTSIDVVEMVVRKRSRSGRQLSLPDILFLSSIGLGTASLPVLVLFVLGAAARGTVLSPAWVPVAYAGCLAPLALAVIFFPLAESVGRDAYGLGETDPAAPIARFWKVVRRTVSHWLRK